MIRVSKITGAVQRTASGSLWPPHTNRSAERGRHERTGSNAIATQATATGDTAGPVRVRRSAPSHAVTARYPAAMPADSSDHTQHMVHGDPQPERLVPQACGRDGQR